MWLNTIRGCWFRIWNNILHSTSSFWVIRVQIFIKYDFIQYNKAIILFPSKIYIKKNFIFIKSTKSCFKKVAICNIQHVIYILIINKNQMINFNGKYIQKIIFYDFFPDVIEQNGFQIHDQHAEIYRNHYLKMNKKRCRVV